MSPSVEVDETKGRHDRQATFCRGKYALLFLFPLPSTLAPGSERDMRATAMLKSMAKFSDAQDGVYSSLQEFQRRGVASLAIQIDFAGHLREQVDRPVCLLNFIFGFLGRDRKTGCLHIGRDWVPLTLRMNEHGCERKRRMRCERVFFCSTSF